MAAKSEDLRKLKDQAAKALEKKSYAKAAELYVAIAEQDDDPDWRQRAGEALRKAGRAGDAIEQLGLATAGYANAGFLLKAIAVCKVILQIDPQHTATQSELARLYAVRDRRPSSTSIPKVDAAAPTPSPTPAASPSVLSAQRAAPPLVPPPRPSPPPPGPALAPVGDLDPVPFAARPAEGGDPELIEIATVSLDELAPPQLAPGAPMDSINLRTVLPAKKSSEVIPRLGDAVSLVPDASAYEIPLEDDDMLLEEEPESSPSPAPVPVAPSAAPVDDELSFAGLDALDDPPPPKPAPAPIAVAPAPAPEESFGDLVLDDASDDEDALAAAIRDAEASVAPAASPAAPSPSTPHLDPPPPGGRPHATGTPPPGGRPHATGTPPPGGRLHATGTPPPGLRASSPSLPSQPPSPSSPSSRASAFTPPSRPTPTPAPAPAPTTKAPSPAKPAVASIADELDFGELLADSVPPPAPPRPALPHIPLFSSLDESELRQLIEGLTVRSLAPGEHLLREGEPGTSLFVIASGEVEVYLAGPPRRSLARLGEGAFVGEQGLLTDSSRSASVVALTPVDVLEIGRDLVARVIASSPDVLKVLLRFFRDRMIDRLLHSSALFTHFSEDDARALVARLRFLELEPGLPVVVEGKPAPGLFILLCGSTEVTRAHGGSVARLGPGDAFGEMSLLRPAPANATVTTLTKCWALQLRRSDFTEIAVTYPQVLEFVSELADRRAAAADRL